MPPGGRRVRRRDGRGQLLRLLRRLDVRVIEQSRERAAIIGQLEATRAELAAAQHEAGRMAERQRLAAEIHDTLAQGFTSILMLIQAAEAGLAGADPQRPGTWIRRADRPGEPGRGAGAGRRPGARAARRRHAAGRAAQAVAGIGRERDSRLAGDTGVPRFELSGTPRPLPMATEVVLLRVCQEALANVRKHACARSATVRLGYDPDAVRLRSATTAPDSTRPASAAATACAGCAPGSPRRAAR